MKNNLIKFTELMFNKPLQPYQVDLVKKIAEGKGRIISIYAPRTGRTYFRNEMIRVIKRLKERK